MSLNGVERSADDCRFFLLVNDKEMIVLQVTARDNVYRVKGVQRYNVKSEGKFEMSKKDGDDFVLVFLVSSSNVFS